MTEKRIKHVVGFSGGIDSQACARWVLNRCPYEDVILLNSDAGGNEHPLTTEFIHWYHENVHPVIMVQAIVGDLRGIGTQEGQARDRRQEFKDTDLMTFDIMAYIKGKFPSAKSQFCTELLKLAPSNRWIKANLEPGTWWRYAGVRRQESEKRAHKQAVEWDDYFACKLIHPIIDWTKQMCFDYIDYHGEKINELYTLGFNRVGCAPCLHATKNDILAWSQRFPEMIDKVRRWEQRVGRTFFSPTVPGMEINFIDDVVAWSKTERGGKELRVLQDRPACESDYGLCE